VSDLTGASMPEGASRPPRPLLPVLALAAAALTAIGYRAVGDLYYGGFALPHGYGMYHLLPQELAMLALFTAMGTGVMACLWLALRAVDSLATWAQRLRRHSGSAVLALGLAAAALAGSLAVRTLVLDGQAVSDDEHVYRFIARTLRTGALTAASPGADLEFFREQFVVLTPAARYGKYPIGYPLLLAVAQTAGLGALLNPLLTALLVLGVWRLGWQVAGPAVALVAALLFATSPQALFTGATDLSQPASAVCFVGALVLVTGRSAQPCSIGRLVTAGLLLAYGILVRPLPSVLMVPLVAFLATPRDASPAVRWRRAGLVGGLAAAGIGAVLLQNRLQSGAALVSGYQAFHSPGAAVGAASLADSLQGNLPARTIAVWGTLLRLDAWLLGWPVSLGLAALAPAHPLAWIVVPEIAYRLLAPKIGVGAVGPIYTYEMIPILCVLSALGARRLARWRVVGAGGVLALVAAGLVVSFTMFVPPRLVDLARMRAVQAAPRQLLARAGVSRALVFYVGGIAPPDLGLTWAYYPPTNGPRLEDDVLYMLLPDGPDAVARAADFWRRRFPDRSPFLFAYEDGRPTLRPLRAPVPGEP
jgi:hypothetical protein